MSEQSLIELHRLRAANLMSMMLLLELGAGIRAEAPREQQAALVLPAKDCAA